MTLRKLEMHDDMEKAIVSCGCVRAVARTQTALGITYPEMSQLAMQER